MLKFFSWFRKKKRSIRRGQIDANEGVQFENLISKIQNHHPPKLLAT
jgi:hypothetical protein